MPPEAPPAPAVDPKQTANNIAKGVQDKASGKTSSQKASSATTEAKKDAEAATPPDPNGGKRKFVVEGKERWLTSEEADAYVQKGLAFEPRISEIARMRQEIQQFEQALLQNPGMILANLAKSRNIPIQTLVEKVLSGNASEEVKEATGKWYWENVAKRHRMDPKDLQILEQEERIKSLEAQDKQKAEMSVAMENRNRVVTALGQVSAQIQETLKELGISNVNGPAAVRITKEIADIMRVSYFSRQPCTAKQAAEKLKARIANYQSQFYDDLEPEQLVSQLGEKNVEKIRNHLLKIVQAAEKGTEQENKNPKPMQKRDERKTMNMDEFHDYLDDLKRKSK